MSAQCEKKILDDLIEANLSQDKGQSFKENKRHFNRDIGQSVEDGINNYSSYLKAENTIFSDSLKKSRSNDNCKNALDSLGRLSHTWQDYFAHAIIYESDKKFTKDVWTSIKDFKGMCDPGRPYGTPLTY